MNWLARLKGQISSETPPAEPTKPGSVGFVGTQNAHSQRVDSVASAANQQPHDPDSWCWPHSPAMNSAEIGIFMARLARFTGKGATQAAAESLADRLVIRDREQDDRVLCLECSHLQRSGRCGNWQRAGVAIHARDAQLAPEFLQLLQRCDGFAGSQL